MRTGEPGLRPATSLNAVWYATLGVQSCDVLPMRKMATIVNARPAMTKRPTLNCRDMGVAF